MDCYTELWYFTHHTLDWIQTNSACGDSDIAIRLFLVKGVKREVKINNDTPQYAKLLLEVKMPCVNANSVICVCSYFGSIAASKSLCVTRL